MTNYKFAKLFDFESGQLLVTLDQDENEDKVLICRSDIPDISLITKQGFANDEAATSAFESFDEQLAISTFTGMHEMLGR